MSAVSNPVRLAFYYGGYFAVTGILLPFWPVWLSSKGLGAAEIGIVLAAAPFVRGFTNPLIAQYADRRGLRKPLMTLMAGAATLSFAAYGVTDGFWPILLVSILFFMFWSSTQPLGESLTMHIVRQEGANYGRIRLWGSITFILTAILGGRVLEGSPPSLIYLLGLTGIALMFVICLILPKSRMQKSTQHRLPIVPLLKSKPFVIMLGAAALIQSSHAVVYGFGTIHWKSIGYSETTIGMFWSIGVIAEIILFRYSAIVLRYLKPGILIALGGAAGIARWLITGSTDALLPLIIAQVLHGLTFGATHLGAIHYISDYIPPSLSATAQSLLASVAMGFAIGITTLLAGSLYGSIGSQAYFAMAGVAVAGTMLGGLLVLMPPKSGVLES
ncbi:MAG: MFS transporter [Proteobacteria bacterium]|nr:MFS transporter [Pseudomonadota bacterium]